jgi:uncharacterized HAD superfamily protein
MNIGIDIDGVLYPWHYSVYKYFTEFKNFIGTQYEFWNYFKKLPKDEQLYIVNLPFLYSDTTPHDDVLETLPLLSTIAEIYYITHRPISVEHQTEKFFVKYNLPFSENVVFTDDKATFIRLKNIKYFVDDTPKNIDDVKGITRAFLFKARHNVDARENYECVSTLREFYNLIKPRTEEEIMKELGYERANRETG